jgi:hypothetical protein
LHLAESGIGSPTLNATLTALRFFFEVTLERAGPLQMSRASVNVHPGGHGASGIVHPRVRRTVQSGRGWVRGMDHPVSVGPRRPREPYRMARRLPPSCNGQVTDRLLRSRALCIPGRTCQPIHRQRS